ncbi:MAG TPA: DEAD/DEAH box helicase [Candidatus Saccharimonadales bacterium]|nr:DEAD/DEAH box helicase [Candidatus Saccharimonadales bacterium]
MYKSSKPSGGRRSGYTVYSSKNHRAPKNRSKTQTIDPARFIKAATAQEQVDYKSTHSFDDFAMHPLLKSNVTSKGYKAPSEIQDKTIALGLAGRNVVGVADTGTGKTAAFALPVLNNIMRRPGSNAIIIAPTRELAIQIEEQCVILSKNSGIKMATLIGGMPMGRQIHSLRTGARLIIGTPGRIKDHLNQGTLKLESCDMAVLDEVDRMLDMGFLPDVRAILSELPERHQAYFFSATLSNDIKNLINTFCHNPEYVNVKGGETSANVHQDVVRYSGKTEKIELLHEELIKEGNTKTIVFGKTKYGVERLAKELVARGFKAESIHGGKTQGQRKRALEAFRQDKANILVATDVAARGIDVKDISHVINYDTPQTYDDYVHRIGRAGRAGRAGHALTFVER